MWPALGYLGCGLVLEIVDERTVVEGFLVEAGMFDAAVAKGPAAASLLTSAPDEPFDDCPLIDDLKDEPAPQITERWPHSPLLLG